MSNPTGINQYTKSGGKSLVAQRKSTPKTQSKSRQAAKKGAKYDATMRMTNGRGYFGPKR